MPPRPMGSEQRSWCGRGELNPHEPCGPTDFLTSYGFHRPERPFSRTASGLWSGLSLHLTRIHSGLRCCPSSLYTFLSETFRTRLARDCHFTGFPEFEQFCIVGFPASTQVGLSPLRLPVPPRPHGAVVYTGRSQSGQQPRGVDLPLAAGVPCLNDAVSNGSTTPNVRERALCHPAGAKRPLKMPINSE